MGLSVYATINHLKMSKILCDICCDIITATKQVTCIICEKVACSKCVRSYLVSSHIVPQCMYCHAIWDRDLLERLLPKTFITKELKRHQESMLFDEMSVLLPTLQPAAAVEMEIQKIHLENTMYLQMIQDTYAKIRECISAKMKRNEFYIKHREYHDTIRDLTIKYDSNRMIIIHLRRGNKIENTKTIQQHIRGCPDVNCRGFMKMNTNELICGMCNIKCCKKCHDVLDENTQHECKDENVETVKMLMKETKPCPKCSARIFKIDGCDLMWCTQCHAAFSWKTGELHKGKNHNPHYYEYLRQTKGSVPRDPDDNPCELLGGFPSIPQFHMFRLKIKDPDANAEMDAFYRIYRNILHIQEVTMPNYQNNQAQNDNTIRDIGIKYLINTYTKEKCKSELYKIEKKKEKQLAIYQILQMLTTASADVMRATFQKDTIEDYHSMIVQLNELKCFANKALYRVAKVYDCVIPIVDSRWDVQILNTKTTKELARKNE